MYRLAKLIVKTDRSLYGLSVSVSVAVETFWMRMN
jgi:hypothetical protein